MIASVSLLVGIFVTAPVGTAAETDQLNGPPAYWTYNRPATHDAVETHVFVPTRNPAVQLGCDLYRPGHGSTPDSGRFPGIVAEFTPYYTLRSTNFSLEGNYFAGRGYNVIVCNVRGTGDSGGTWTQLNSPMEAEDNYDLIEWLAAQPWSDGKVGQQGESYGGFTTYRVAALQPPHLVAIAPQQSQDNVYTNAAYPGGIWTTPGIYGTGAINSWPPVAQALSGGRIDAAEEWATWKNHPTQDAFWDQIAVSTRYDQIKAPILAAGGWQDMWFRKSMIGNYEALKSHTWITYGPWTHATPYGYEGCLALCVSNDAMPPGALLAWWDHWLEQNPSAPLPQMRFTTYEGPMGIGAGWQQLPDWPPADVQNQRLYPGAHGQLAAAQSEPGQVSFTEPNSPSLPNYSVSFTSTPLASGTVLAGSAHLHLIATLGATDANFYAQLDDVAPDGTATKVNDGFLLASHRLSDRQPMAITPGVATSYDFDVWPQDWRFAAGHSLRLTISGGDPIVLSPPPPVTVALSTSGSYVDFPLRGAAL